MKYVVFCLDFEKCYKRSRYWSDENWGALKGNIAILVDRLKPLNIPTVYFAHSETFVPLQKGVELFEAIPPKLKTRLARNNGLEAVDFDLPPDALFAVKKNYSAYQEKAIAKWLKTNGYSGVILCGLFEAGEEARNGYCVSETAHDLVKAGFDVIIAAEATDLGIKGNDDFLPLDKRREIHSRWGARIEPIKDIPAIIGGPVSSIEVALRPNQNRSAPTQGIHIGR
ncbi:MAG: isochorismatase family protein [Alphaproteobacteria bacterium]|nr:isochorismatase family protein [Alphaproteobacteria bacterium]